MENVFAVVARIFNAVFVNVTSGGYTRLNGLIRVITSSPYLLIGIVFVIVGFAFSLLKRIIHS